MSNNNYQQIYSNDGCVIPMADVQNIETTFNENMDITGGFIITKHTKWNFEHDIWENAIYMPAKKLANFKKIWCNYIEGRK